MNTLQRIKDMAMGTEERPIRHVYNDEELTALREEFTENELTLDSEQEALEEIKKEFKARIDVLKEKSKLRKKEI